MKKIMPLLFCLCSLVTSASARLQNAPKRGRIPATIRKQGYPPTSRPDPAVVPVRKTDTASIYNNRIYNNGIKRAEYQNRGAEDRRNPNSADPNAVPNKQVPDKQGAPPREMK